jgi:hypothetical protein
LRAVGAQEHEKSQCARTQLDIIENKWHKAIALVNLEIADQNWNPEQIGCLPNLEMVRALCVDTTEKEPPKRRAPGLW